MLLQARWAGDQPPLAAGKHTIVFDFKYDGPGVAKGGSGVLKVDGSEVRTLTVPKTIPFLLPVSETFDVGVDTRTGVNDLDYQVPFKFNGKIDKLTFNLGPTQLAPEVMCNWPPVSITTDKLGSYPKALRRLKRKGELKDTVQHRTSRYLNNRIEADHGALKRLIRPTRGFQSMKTAYATIKGFEVMRMIRRRHCILIEPGVTGEVRFVNKLFNLAA